MVALVLVLGCDDSGSPVAPDAGPAIVTIGIAAVVATAPPCCEHQPFTYRASLTLTESGGLGALLSEVAVTFTDVSGSRSVRRIAPVEVFGTTRVSARAGIAGAATATGELLTAADLSIEVTFSDDRGNRGSARTSATVRLDLTGTWDGPLPIKTDPPGDWSLSRLSLVQSGDALTGEIASREGVRFPVRGTVSREWAPELVVDGLPGTSTCAGVSMVFSEVEFGDGRARLSGHATGRCFGTVAGTFTLARSG